MTHPVNWPKKTFFYPIGNTPPVCFTQDLAPEENADILLLACGDPRSILYTVYADLAPEFRNLDITCCDWEPAILARNILLITMIADDVSPVDAWPIFYHLFFDRKCYNILLAQCRTLIQAASDMQTWKSSKYGAYLRFCTEQSLVEIRRHWVLYLETGDLSDKDQKALKMSFTSGMKSVLDNNTEIVSTSLRAAGPVDSFSILEHGQKLFRAFWTTGVTSFISNPNTSPPFVNPSFVYSLSGKRFNVHYGTHPIIAFHLAPAMADIKGAQSPSIIGPQDLVASSMNQFSSWWSSFKRRLATGSKANIIIRFFCGETLAFCRALNVCKKHQVTDTGVYASPWGGTQINLDLEEYNGPSPLAPLSFNIIDTSNLTDHAGLLNILITTVPLLQRKPWSVVYTNTMLANFDKGETTSGLTEKACGDIPTLSILLGIAPSPNLFHFTTHSNKHELLASSIAISKSGLTQVHETLVWRFPTSVVAASTLLAHNSKVEQSLIVCDAIELAKFLFSVYLRMFAAENQIQNMRDIGTANSKTSLRNQVNINYTRASFVGLLALVKPRVETDWLRSMEHLFFLIADDRTLLMGSNAYQDLLCEMYMQNIHSFEVFGTHYLESVRTPRDRFFGWKEVPPIVCLLLKVPRHHLKPLEESDPDQIGAPMLQCELMGANKFHNIHTNIQLIFGELEVSKVAGETFAVIKEDPKGWEGKSPLIVSFYIPSWILTVAPMATHIGLHVRTTPQSYMALMEKLGMRLTIYSTVLSDMEQVKVVRHRPNKHGEIVQMDHFRHLFSPAGTDDSDQRITLKFDSFGRKAMTLTIRDNIRDAAASKSLADKAEVTVTPLADCTILVSYRRYSRHFIFPFPVRSADSKLRIARKSSYLEIEATIRPHFEDFLDLSLNPFSIYRDNQSINLLNVHYLKLDAIPALKLPSTKKKLEWLSLHMAMTLSETEKKVSADLLKQEDKGTMVCLKESIAMFFIKYSGLDDRRHTRKPFGLCNPVDDVGVYTLIFVNDIKLDVASHTVVVDACVVPLIEEIMSRISPALQKVIDDGFIEIVTFNDETRAWRLLLPAFAERCRTWKHLDTCEYQTKGIPAEVNGLTISPLCSCGKGKNLGSFANVPDWKLLRSEATRIAIGPLFSFSSMEEVAKFKEVMDSKAGQSSGPRPQPGVSSSSSSLNAPQCARCRGPGKPTLLVCSVCKNTKYCSRDCQKNDWKTHKLQCVRAA